MPRSLSRKLSESEQGINSKPSEWKVICIGHSVNESVRHVKRTLGPAVATADWRECAASLDVKDVSAVSVHIA